MLEWKIVINRGKRKGKEFRKNEQNSIFFVSKKLSSNLYFRRVKKKRKLEKIILELRYIATLYPGEKKWGKIRGNCRKLVIILARFVFFYSSAYSVGFIDRLSLIFVSSRVPIEIRALKLNLKREF